MRVNGLIPAAGMSRRMGQFKPLLRIGEKTMIETTVDRMLEAGTDCVTVVLGYRGEEVKRLLRKGLEKDPALSGRLRFAYNPDPAATQMLDSVKAGLRRMETCSWFFLSPGDMPAISSGTYRALCRAAVQTDKKVIFPTLDGYRKHPPLISWDLREPILGFEGEGLREFWKQYEGQILEIPLHDAGCAMDVDVPSDYRKVCAHLENIQ